MFNPEKTTHMDVEQVELTQTNQLFQYLPEGEQGQKSSAMNGEDEMEQDEEQ